MTNLRVGMRVVCIREHDPEIRSEMALFGVSAPKLRHIYTIRQLRNICGVPDVLLHEIINPSLTYIDGIHTEQGFAADRFRPVADRKTDISALTALLNTSRVEEPA